MTSTPIEGQNPLLQYDFQVSVGADTALNSIVEAVDKNREWIERTFGLSIADWAPGRRDFQAGWLDHAGVTDGNKTCFSSSRTST